MKKYDSLLQKIAEEYNIRKGITESLENWQARIIYSIIGRMGYASLWDIQHDLNPTSIVHFKKRIRSSLYSYLQLYPSVKNLFLADIDELATEIYNIFSSTGCIYHTPFRIAPSQYSFALQGEYIYTRGCLPSEKTYICGLGSYNAKEKDVKSSRSLSEMFQFNYIDLKSYWIELIKTANWKESNIPEDAEFLRHSYFKNGYWCNTPNTSGAISVFRVGMPSERLYYLYKFENVSPLISILPSWKTNETKYRLIANACLHINNNLPPIQYSDDGDLITINFLYLPPIEILNFIKLYSWPYHFNSVPCDFKRTITKSVFDDIKKILETKGFSFEEI